MSLVRIGRSITAEQIERLDDAHVAFGAISEQYEAVILAVARESGLKVDEVSRFMIGLFAKQRGS